jgi:hypothetical protein
MMGGVILLVVCYGNVLHAGDKFATVDYETSFGRPDKPHVVCIPPAVTALIFPCEVIALSTLISS